MAKDIENALKSVANQIAKYVEDAAEMRVETLFVVVDTGASAASNFDQAKPAAMTVVKLDGDSQTTVPLRQGEDGLEVDEDLLDVHERNVATAIEYRASMLETLVAALQAAVQG